MRSLKERVSDFIESNGLPTICIEHSPDSPNSNLSSYFGGAPYTPENFTWPIHPVTGKPRIFLAQLNFEDLWRAIPNLQSNLPRSGLLQFFYRSSEDIATAGFDGEDQEDVTFIWYPNLQNIDHLFHVEPSNLATPPEAHRISFSMCQRGVSGDMLAESGLFSNEEVAQWWFERNRLHQIQGSFYPIQYDPLESITPNQTGGIWQRWNRKKEENRSTWELLWQIDSDATLGYMWGNDGMIYIMVNKDDLVRGDISNLRFNLQTT